MKAYANTPTVVVVLVPLRGGLLMVRRALPGDGQGRLALPGGYQMLGQTWQEAGAAEVREETGVSIDPVTLEVIAVETTPDRQQNLIFCGCLMVEHAGPFEHDAEVSEVLIVREPVETAFPLHTRQVRAFFDRRSQPTEGTVLGSVNVAPRPDPADAQADQASTARPPKIRSTGSAKMK